MEGAVVRVMGVVGACALVGSVMVAGCGGGGQKEAWQLAQDSAAAAAWRAAEAGMLVRGTVMPWSGGWMLVRCQASAKRLVDSTANKSLFALIQPMLAKRGDSVFAELRVVDTAGTSVAVRSVRRLTEPNIGGGCAEPAPQFLWRATGGPPPWRVEVGAERVVLTTPDNLTGQPFREVPPYWAGATRVYKGFASVGADRLIEVRISRAACRDSTSGAFTGYTAEVRRKNGTVLACAVAGMAEPASMKNLTR